MNHQKQKFSLPLQHQFWERSESKDSDISNEHAHTSRGGRTPAGGSTHRHAPWMWLQHIHWSYCQIGILYERPLNLYHLIHGSSATSHSYCTSRPNFRHRSSFSIVTTSLLYIIYISAKIWTPGMSSNTDSGELTDIIWTCLHRPVDMTRLQTRTYPFQGW